MNKDQTKTPLDAFNIATKSEDGVKMPLRLPDGTPTEHFFVIRGGDSPTFRKAQARINREKVALLKVGNGKEMDPADRAMREASLQRNLVASLVAGWSFSDSEIMGEGNCIECTPEKVSAFLETAPQIQEEVDAFAGQRSNFFNKPSID